MDEHQPYDPLRVPAEEPYDLSGEDRFRHAGVFGKSGVGKSSLLFNTALDDIESGAGLAFIDPHGDEAEQLLSAIPERRINDVIYLNLSDTEFPIAFNPVAGVPVAQRPGRIAAVVSGLAHMFSDAWGHSTEQIMRHSVATLMDTPGMSLVALPRLLTDDAFRETLVARVTDPLVRSYWHYQYGAYCEALRDQKSAPPANKIEELIAHPQVRNCLAAGTNRLDPRTIIDTHKILICSLAKGFVGESATNVFGSLIMSLLGTAAMSRSDTPEEQRKPFYLIVDEAHSFATDLFASFVSEFRKYRLGLVLATQYTEQLHPKVLAGLMGAVATFVVFRVSGADAELLAPEFGGLETINLTHQKIGHAWVRREHSFSAWTGSNRSAVTLAPRRVVNTGQRDKVVARSRRVYAKPRAEIEKSLYRYFQSDPASAPKRRAG